MERLIRYCLFCVCLMSVLVLSAQNNQLNQKINLPSGQVMLKTALKSISNQTGYVFSYDPTKIIDKQLISISTNNLSLISALKEILPKNIQFKFNGKYIVLQQISKISKKLETKEVKQPKQDKSTEQKAKGKGTISNNPKLERLVLPPLKSNEYKKVIAQKVENSPRQPIDSLEITQPNQQPDSNLREAIAEDSIPKVIIPTDGKKTNHVPKTLAVKVDTTTIHHPGLIDFLKKNIYSEIEVSTNKQLGALSIHMGLYNVYSIFSIGSDYHDSYLFGIGIGAKIKLDTHFSLNFDLLQNSLIAGKSYLLNVRASNTQLSPILNFTILKSFKLFAGPTLNLIKSSYEGGTSSTDLGVLVGIGFSAGIKIDLKNLLSKHS